MRYLRLLFPAILAGCSYDWEIGAPASDGGPGGGSAGGHDAGIDGGHDAGADGGHDGGPDCATLEADLTAAAAAAKACTFGDTGQCSTSIVDQCGCTSYVAHGGSAAAVAFAAAVQEVTAAKCATSCSTCLLSPGACLLSGGMPASCVP